MLSATCVVGCLSLMFDAIIDDWFSVHSSHLSSIKIVSVYDEPYPSLCRVSTTLLEPVYALSVKVKLDLKMVYIWVAKLRYFSLLVFGSFTIPQLASFESRHIIHDNRLKRSLFISHLVSIISCGVGGHEESLGVALTDS